MSNVNQVATTVPRMRKPKTRQILNLINRNSLTTALLLGTFAAILTGKILTAPHDNETERWMDESAS